MIFWCSIRTLISVISSSVFGGMMLIDEIIAIAFSAKFGITPFLTCPMDYLIIDRLEVVITVIDANHSNIFVLPISNTLSKVTPANLIIIKSQRMVPTGTARNGNSLFLVR